MKESQNVQVMKILIVRTFPYELNLNSYNCQETGLAAALRKKGVVCDIVLHTNGKTRTEHRPDGITIYWIHSTNILKNGLFPGIYDLMEQYDVIQVHEYDQIQSWKIYTRHNQKHNVVLYHGPYLDPFNRGYNFKCKVFDRFFLPESREAKASLPCLTKSPLAADFLKSKGFRNVTSVGVGLNPAPFDAEPDMEKAGQMPSDVPSLVYIGVLEERRNTVFLLDLVEELAKTEAFHMTIVGKGDPSYLQPIEEKMHALEKRGILTWYPSAAQPEVAGIYKKADLLLFPTNYDIFGMVLLEAMYCGVPCVSSINGGSSTLIENGVDGVTLPDFDQASWIHAIRDLLHDPDKRTAMAEKASTKIREHYTWDALSEKFLSVYQSLSRD